MAMLGEIHLILSARLEGNEPYDVATVTTSADPVEVQRRIEQFAAAVIYGEVPEERSEVRNYPAGRMIGAALDIDPNPEFEEHLMAAKARHSEMERPGLLDGPEHVIIGGRQEGKTRLALKWLESAPEGVERVLVVEDGDTAGWMNRDAGRPVRSPRVISFRTLINQGPRSGVEYGIDESVRILSTLLGLKQTPRLVTVGHAEAWQTGPEARP